MERVCPPYRVTDAANVSVYVPKTLSYEEKEAIEKFRQSDNFKGDAATKRSIFQKFKNYFS